MSGYSVFKLLEQPRTSTFKALGDELSTTLIGGGIVNPFGPTLTAIVVPGMLTKGKDKTIFSVV